MIRDAETCEWIVTHVSRHKPAATFTQPQSNSCNCCYNSCTILIFTNTSNCNNNWILRNGRFREAGIVVFTLASTSAKHEQKHEGPPESPTTARELDFDDDDIPASPKPRVSADVMSPPPRQNVTAGDGITPPQDPRPTTNPRDQAENILRDAFPTIEPSVIRAVLVASGGQVEPAFNALLSMNVSE